MIEGSKKAVLLIGEGSPKSIEIEDVKSFYTKYFKSRHLAKSRNKIEEIYYNKVTFPKFLKERAEAYKSACFDGEMANDIALENLRLDVEKEVKIPVYKAFIHRDKSIENSLTEAYAKGAEHLLVVPLFPFYTALDYDQALLETFKVAGDKHPDLNLVVIPPIFNHKGFAHNVEELVSAQKEMFGLNHLHILFKGIPRDLDIEYISEEEKISYLQQVNKSLNIIEDKIDYLDLEISHSFLPMKLGEREYFQPNSYDEVKNLLAKGVRNITFIYPSTMIDNVDSLHDVEVEFRNYVESLGFDKVDFIPSLNNHPHWKNELSRWIDEWLFS